MILFGSPISPFVRKVAAYAAERQLSLQFVGVGLNDPNPDFQAASPFRKMPAFKDGDFSISDSTAIITYLEAKFPDSALLPADPANRARAIWFDEFADTILSTAGGKIFFNTIVAPKFLGREGDAALIEQGKGELPAIYDYLESVLPASGFVLGDALTLADISIASPFVNLLHCGIKPDASKYPKLSAYLTMMHARPSFAATIAREAKIVGAV